MNLFTCFGEVLWDVFPDQEKIGGAPLNVALRLQSYLNDVAIISSVGNDVLGKKLKDFILKNNLKSDYLQTDKILSTGRVNVTLDDKGSASYEISQPVAWDNIQLNQASIDRVKQSDVFIFGSLSSRNSVSKQTLLELLDHAKFKVFDVNLRPPFYNLELLQELMYKVDFIKFNDDELELISNQLNSGTTSIEKNISFISKMFRVGHICVTRGSKGAIFLSDGKMYSNDGYKINVKDTVGAGDSFLASLLHKITSEDNNQKALDFACAVGALVAASEGANPKIREIDIDNIMSRK
ncbi:MAG TPA: carbohydrate kinase [Flavobacteriaceae bacterium]|nr:carbohydrate kinase [Flavobacteriaceae bacterium]